MEAKILEDIGLTSAEIRVYIAILELGTSTSGPIIERSGLQASVVFMTLHHLIDKGLISFVKEGRIRNYQAANPSHILEFIDEKKERLRQIIPELLAKQKQARQKPEVTTFQGIRGIRELLYELLEAGGKEHHTLGSTQKSLMMGEQWWREYHKKRAAKGITAKLLFNESLKSWMAQSGYGLIAVKYTSKGFEPLTETIIRNDKVGIIIWTEKPLGILVHSSAAAESYDSFFKILWNSAEY